MNRLMQVLLWLYPASWRAEYGGPMLSLFRARWRAEEGWTARTGLMLAMIPDLVVNAVAVQWDLLRQDVRYAVGSLGRAPGFALSAIAIAGLGIGATTAAFSMLHHVFLEPLPFAHQDRLVKLREDDLQGTYRFWETSPANYRDWKHLSHCFETLGAYRSMSVNWRSGVGEPERLDGASLTAEVLPLLGVQPVLGRVFRPEEDRDTAQGTVVLSYSLWKRQFGDSSAVLGRTVLLDQLPYTVIGVMPEQFYFPDRTALYWTPMRWGAGDFGDRRDTYIFPVGLLKPGVSLAQARAEMQTVAKRVARLDPDELAYVSIAVLRLRDFLPRSRTVMMEALLGAALCVLLIACTNLANLLLARAMVRRRELAVRAALGAGRERLVRQVLTESLTLAIPGGLVGLLLARLSLPLLVLLVPDALPIARLPELNGTVLLFAVVLTFLTGIGFGVLPAMRTSVDTAIDLNQGGRSGIGARREGLRAGLVVTEVACAVLLIASCGLLARALWRVQGLDPGFRADHVLTMRTQLPMPEYEKVEAREPFYRNVLGSIRSLPGVKGAAYTSFLPMAMGGGIWPVEIQGRPEDVSSRRTASLRFVTPGYFAAMQIPLVSGRDVRQADTNQAPYVAVVSRSFVKRYWGEQNPLGRRINVGNHDRQVIGVVGDIRTRGPETESEPQVYVSWQQADNVATWYAPKDLVVRTTGDPDQIASAVRRIIHQADARLAISDVRTLNEVVSEQTTARRVALSALSAFGAIAVLLAVVGIHAVLAFAVATRQQEIGVRMALGARARDILRKTLLEGLRMAALGIAIGCALAMGVGRLLQSQLAGISPVDPESLAGAASLALLMALAGGVLPALRGARVDPMTAIRSE